jgi:recombination associated protein RdgC
MWFTNAHLFQFIDKPNYQVETLDSALEDLAFTPCAKHAANSIGWESPLQMRGAPLVHASNGFLLMCLRIEEKVIPASVIKQKLEEKIEEITSLEQRKVSRKEKIDLKENIYQNLLPQAFCQSTRLYGYIDTVDGWLVINTSSTKKAELFTVMLRKALGHLKIQLPQVHAPATIMSQWIKQQSLPAGFELSDYCILHDLNEETASIRCQKQDLLSDDIQACVSEGRFVGELGIHWQEQISFVVHKEFSLRKIKFADVIKEQAKENYTENFQEEFDANFTLMTLTLRQLLREIMSVFASHSTAEVHADSSVV